MKTARHDYAIVSRNRPTLLSTPTRLGTISGLSEDVTGSWASRREQDVTHVLAISPKMGKAAYVLSGGTTAAKFTDFSLFRAQDRPWCTIMLFLMMLLVIATCSIFPKRIPCAFFFLTRRSSPQYPENVFFAWKAARQEHSIFSSCSDVANFANWRNEMLTPNSDNSRKMWGELA